MGNKIPKDEASLVELLNRANLHLIGLSDLVRELSEHIAEQKPNVPNILSGTKMAEYLGVTQKALEHRRVRGQFPSSACAKLGRYWFYNVAIYEAWKEDAWAKATPLASAPSSANQKLNGQKGKKTNPSSEIHRLV